MATIAGLVVEISANAQKFHRAVQSIQTRAKRFAGQLKSIIGTAVKAVVAGATAAAAAVTAVVTTTSMAMRDLVRDSEAVGVAARDLQSWQVAAEGMGIQADKVQDIFKDLADKTGDFARTGGGEAADIFEQLGISAQELLGLSPDKALLRINSALEGLSQGEKIFFMESIADDASRLLPLLDNNAERFRTLVAEGERWGTIMTDAEIKASAALGNTLTKAGNMAKGFKNLLGASLAPTFQGVIAWIESITESMGGPRVAAAKTAEAIKQSFVFVANAVDGLKRVFEIAGASIAVFTLQAQKAVNDLAEAIYSGPIDAVNVLIKGLNKATGTSFGEVSQPGFVQDLQSRSAGLDGAISVGKSDIRSLLESPLAGDAVSKFIAGAEAQAGASDSAAKSVADLGSTAASVSRSMESVARGLLPTNEQGAVPNLAGAPAAGLNLSSIAPMSQSAVRAMQASSPAATGAAVSAAASATTGQGGRMGGGRDLGTLTLKNDKGESAEFFTENAEAAQRWLADTLSGAAASV